MPITNEQISDALTKIADALEEQSENYYKIRAYRRAAYSTRRYKESISSYIAGNKDLTEIPNVGSKIAQVIQQMVITENLNWLPKAKPAEPYPEHLKNKKRKISYYKIYR